MEIVINKCFGGFGLSPEATIEAWKRGSAIVQTYKASEYFHRETGYFSREAALKEWRDYLAGGSKSSLFLTVFSPDESLVLSGDRRKGRDCPVLVQIVEEMGELANGRCAQLAVVEIPDGVEYEIKEYDGNEYVAEVHRTWG